jgi:hypothetical protein
LNRTVRMTLSIGNWQSKIGNSFVFLRVLCG